MAAIALGSTAPSVGRRLRGTGPSNGLLADLVLLIEFVQMPFFGWVPVRRHTVMLTAAIGCGALDERLGRSSFAEAAPMWT